MKWISWSFLSLFLFMTTSQQAISTDSTRYWMKIYAEDKFQRSVLADMGIAIDGVKDEYVYAVGNLEDKNLLENKGWLVTSFPLTNQKDFPVKDSEFHNYAEMKAAIEKLANENPTFMQKVVVGHTFENREILGLRISTDLATASQKPAILFMGGHHAREHISVELPLRFAQYLALEYNNQNARIQALIEGRDIHIIPAVNPDGLEYDVATGKYQYWRKNRAKNKNNTFGVDLNRNYGYKWGTGGSSNTPSSDVYMGPKPFSEPETQAIKNYVETNTNITIAVSFHTFSELILYPWGYSNDPIKDQKDFDVHKLMAEKMAVWNGYEPQQSSDLYIASGDTTDWTYGEHKMISFTFELDPKSSAGQAGFYPGAKAIQQVVDKNIEPCLYLIGYADNPYRALEGGINSQLGF